MKVNMPRLFIFCLICSALSLFGCSGGGDGTTAENSSEDLLPATTTAISKGKFIDSPVMGISYQTKTQSGTTNSLGTFEYVDGETITFSIAGISLPPVTAAAIVTPLEIAGSQDVTDQAVVNIIRFLQTIDADANPDNGITINSDVEQFLTGAPEVDFTVEETVFELVFNAYSSQMGGPTLIDRQSAIEHFQENLDELKNAPELVDYADFVNNAQPVEDCLLASDANCTTLPDDSSNLPLPPVGDMHSGIMDSGLTNGDDNIFWGTNVGIRLWSVEGATEYKLYMAPYPAGTPVTVTTIASSQLIEIDNSSSTYPGDRYYSAMLSGLTDGASYYYAFSAVNEDGESDFAEKGQGHFTITAFPAMDDECKQISDLAPTDNGLTGTTVRHLFSAGYQPPGSEGTPMWLWNVWWPVPEVNGCLFAFENYDDMKSCSAYFEIETEYVGQLSGYDIPEYEENFQTTFYFNDGQEYHCSGTVSGGNNTEGTISLNIDGTSYESTEGYFYDTDNDFTLAAYDYANDLSKFLLSFEYGTFNGVGQYDIGYGGASTADFYDCSDADFIIQAGDPYEIYLHDPNWDDYAVHPSGTLTISSYTPGERVQGSYQYTAVTLDCFPNTEEDEDDCPTYSISGTFDVPFKQ